MGDGAGKNVLPPPPPTLTKFWIRRRVKLGVAVGTDLAWSAGG